MSRIPVPERGQPIDLSYIYTIAEAINELSEKGSALTQSNNFYFRGSKSASPESSKLYSTNVYASYHTIATESNVSAGYEESITVSFPPDITFSTTPVITATAVALNDNDANRSASVILSNVDATGYKVTVKFATSGKVSLGVNVIAVGPPTG